MVKLISVKDTMLAGVTLVVGASIAICYDILQDAIQSVAPNTELVIKLESAGISIGFGVFFLVLGINLVNKKM